MLSIDALNFLFIGEFTSLIGLLCGEEPVNVCVCMSFFVKIVLLETYLFSLSRGKFSYSIATIIL